MLDDAERNSTPSRRTALLAMMSGSLGAMSLAPAKAKSKKKKGKKKPPAPLAYAVVFNLELSGQPNTPTLPVQCRIAIYHPGSGDFGGFTFSTDVGFARFEADFTARVRSRVADELTAQGVPVPANRVAVTLV